MNGDSWCETSQDEKTWDPDPKRGQRASETIEAKLMFLKLSLLR
jgi:hypothetical protein